MSHAPCPIAVIGIGCIFPGSRNVREFWNTILYARDCITEVPDTHWSRADYFDADPKAPDRVYCTRGGFLPKIDFDPAAFGIPPANLDATDTSQLLGLVVARAALEDAGYLDRPFDRDRAAVILGVTGTQELTIPLASRLGHPHWRRALLESGVDPQTAQTVIERISEAYVEWQENSFPGLLGNVVAGRIANRLDLRGPNCVVDAACASSLAALNLALQELESRRSDLVLTGGVDTLNDIFMHMCFSQSGLLSKSGDIRPFSADADGTLLGEGIGMVVLKRLADAERDGDRIYAVIRGLGASSDGKSQSIYAPRVEGQVQALRRAYQTAGIDPTTVGLIEAHGTGTRVGDRVEFEALRQVFDGSDAVGKGPRRVIGSVKSQIGHTKAAAGAAGLIKAVLSLHHKVLPPTIKVEKPDPELRIDETSFALNRRAKSWLRPKEDSPRRAAVSSFGFGGSNFHVVLEEAADAKPKAVLWDDDIQIVAFSAPERTRLCEALDGWIEKAASDRNRLPVMAAETRRTFRPEDPFRLLAVVQRSESDAGPNWLEDLRNAGKAIRNQGSDGAPSLPQSVYFGTGLHAPKIGLLFPGQGSQYPGMGRDWFVRFPEAFSVLEAMGSVMADPAALFDAMNPIGSDGDAKGAADRLALTDVAQPAIGAVSIGMWSVLRSFGIAADVLCGHSYGEICALHAAGGIDREAFIRLSVARGRAMAEAAACSPGGMLAVLAEEAISRDICRDIGGLVLANRNAPKQCVLSGPVDAIEGAKALCDARGIRSVRLPVSAAFHSPAMRPAVDRFREALRQETVHPTDILVLSNADGKRFPKDADALRHRLAEQIASPVDFVSCMQTMIDRGVTLFVEVGPKAVLSGLVRECVAGRPNSSSMILSLDRGTDNALIDLAHVLCGLAAAGYPLTLDRWHPCDVGREDARKPVLNIRLCGANYRKPCTSPSEKAAMKPLPEAVPPNFLSFAEPQSECMTVKPMQADPIPYPNSDIHSYHQTLQQGIRSIEAMQRKTAEIHQQFLHTQAEAMRLVQQMVTGSHPAEPEALQAPVPRKTETHRAPLGDVREEGISAAPRVFPRDRTHVANGYHQAVAPEKDHDTRCDGPMSSDVRQGFGAAPSDARREPSSVPEVQGSSAATAASIESVLLDVVSRLTGYPADVLGLDMDIEADLGIDSIKRVEILSAMEEAVPGLSVPAPDEMAALKTLRQIVDVLDGSRGGRSEQKPEGSEGHAKESFRELMVDAAKDPTGSRGNEEAGIVDGASVKSPVSADPAASDRILGVLLEAVSRLTGYPVDVLGLDMDIEADLGIDSIKRVEILAAVEEALPDVVLPAPDVSAGLRSLRQIADLLCSGKRVPSAEIPAASSSPKPATSDSEPIRSKLKVEEPKMKVPDGIELPLRRVLGLKETDVPERDPAWENACDGVFLVTGLHPDVQRELAETLADRLRCRVENVPLADALDRPVDGLLRGLVIVAPSSAPSSEAEMFDEKDEAFLIDSLALCSRLAASLQRGAASGPAVLAGVSFLDGGFGLCKGTISRPIAGGIGGLIKTAGWEWPQVRCLAVDIDPAWTDLSWLAARLGDVLLARWQTTAAVEVGISEAFGDRRGMLPVLDTASYPQPTAAFDFRREDVVLISGGARGVAASVAVALAKAGVGKMVLLGRSSEPVDEPAWLCEAADVNAMRRILVQRPEHAGKSPKDIDRMARHWLANREIARTLNAIRAAGAEALYRSVDVTDREAVLAVFQEITAVWGPVTGIVHAAGVLADRLIVEASVSEARKVLAPKLHGLRHLVVAASGQPPRWFALFSSIAGRMGNRGQAAYAMANEAMNKIARCLKRRYPDMRVVSLNWGPWNGGMVNEGLKKMFQANGVPLIDIEAGAAAFLAEMRGADDAVEVVIGGDLPGPNAIETERRGEALRLSIKKEIDVERYPVLNSHVREGIPVVPFSLATEWLGYGALHENPGLFLSGLEDIRLLKGIRLQHQPMTVRLMTGKPVKRDRAFVLDVEIRDGMREGKDVVHTRGKAVLTDGFEAAPDFDPEPLLASLNGYSKAPEEFYGAILPQGKDLRGIRRVIGMSPRAMAAELLPAPHPENWMSEPIRKRWLADPLVLDGAFQMAAIWCHEHLGQVCQPVFAKRYRQYRGRFPEDGVLSILEIRESGTTGMVADITFLDAEHRVVASFEGLTTTADASPWS